MSDELNQIKETVKRERKKRDPKENTAGTVFTKAQRGTIAHACSYLTEQMHKSDFSRFPTLDRWLPIEGAKRHKAINQLRLALKAILIDCSDFDQIQIFTDEASK